MLFIALTLYLSATSLSASVNGVSGSLSDSDGCLDGRRHNCSHITPYHVSYDVTYDVTLSPSRRVKYAATTSWEMSRKDRGKGYLRMRSKYRNYFSKAYDDDEYSNEYWIKRTIMTNYDRNTMPIRKDLSMIPLYIGMSLYHILDTNEKYQTLSALIAVRLWNASQFSGIDRVWIPSKHLWVPDIFINNFADSSFRDFATTQAIVTSRGDVLWMFPAVIKVYCTLDVRHFPFDTQSCPVVFISWTFHGFILNVTYNESEPQTVYYTPRNQEWYVSQVTVERHEKIYACCAEPFPDVTFTIHMSRRSLFYVVSLIFPCLLIYAVSFLGFFLPTESGDKVNLEITVLLALVVFLLIAGETLPPTPDAIPALGLLFGLTMLMVSIALIMAVIVTNVYLRKDSSKPVPRIIRFLFLHQTPACFSYRYRQCPTSEHRRAGRTAAGLKPTGGGLRTRDAGSAPPSETRATERKAHQSRCTELPTEEHCASLTGVQRNEWQRLAKSIDRLFFWIFLAISVGCLLAMYIRLPSSSGHLTAQ